jgi:hypothetical protein
MPEVHKTRDFDKPADEMWDLIGDFHGLHKWSGAEPSESIEDGTARKFQIGPTTLIERLVEEGDRSYTYSMDDGGLPVKGYVSTISVLDRGDGKCTVDWVGKFDPADPDNEEGAVQIITMIYEGGLAAMEKTVSS